VNYRARPAEFHSWRLSNGLHVIAECHPEAYSVGLGLFVGVGSRDEPPEWSGVSHFLEHMAFKGNDRYSAEELNKAFEQIGAFHNAITDEECTTYHLAVLPEYWPRALELLGELVRPTLDPQEFELERRVILEEIHMDEDSPPFNVEDRCRAIYFGDHPLGQSISGTKETISALRPEMMRRYLHSRYGPDTAVLVAAGRVDFSHLVAKAEEVFGRWEPCGYRRPLTPVKPQDRFVVISKSEAQQQYLIQMVPAPAGLPDWVAVWLLTAIIGGHAGGRMFWEFIDPGLVESVDIEFEEYQGAAAFVISMVCQPERAQENLDRLFEFYRRLPRRPIEPQELEWAKNKVSSGLVLASERPISRLAVIGDDWVLEKRYYSVAELLELVAAVRPERIMELVEQYPLDRGTVVTIGPVESLSPPVPYPGEACLLESE
jgi:predicted Zn-dependent peptidase